MTRNLLYSKTLHVDGRIILELIFGKSGRKLWTGGISLRTGSSGGLL